LCLVVPANNIDELLDSNGIDILHWIYRGVNHYIFSKLSSEVTIGNFAINGLIYDYEYVFGLFCQMILFEPHVETFVRWWERRGVLFFRFASSKEFDAPKTMTRESLLVFKEIFDDLIVDYNDSYENLKVDGVISMCFEPGWTVDLQHIVCNDESEAVRNSIARFLSVCYQSAPVIFRRVVVIPQSYETYSSVQKVFWVKDVATEKGRIDFKLLNFSKSTFECEIRYNSLEDLEHLEDFVLLIRSLKTSEYSLEVRTN
jgi:hypothetical protein